MMVLPAGLGIVRPSAGGGGGNFPTFLDNTATESSGSAATPKTVSYPATVASSDRLILLVAWGAQTVTITTPSGWTQKHLNQGSGTGCNIAVYEKIAAGTEGGTTFTVSFSSAARCQFQVIRIQAGTSNSTEVTGNNGGVSTATTCPCPTNTPSWGTKKTLWIAGLACNSSVTVTAYPLANNQVRTANASVVGTYRTLATCTVDDQVSSKSPGNFTIGAANLWATVTIAVEPV